MLVRESRHFAAAVKLVESCQGDPALTVAQRIKVAELSLNLACLDAGLGRLGWFGGSAVLADRPDQPDRVSSGFSGV